MSLSNQTDIKSPAQKYFEWSSTDKTVKWYDKEAKQNVLMELPFTFIVLDMLSTVKGFSDADGGGIWSNEVRDTRTNILTVKTKRGVKAQGLWKEDIKNVVDGARYCRSVYIAYKEDGELVIGNFQVQGSANSAWIEFSKHTKVYGIGIQITGSVERKKGATTFYEPVFKAIDATEETIAQAIELDKELQEYLKIYLGREQEAVEQSGDLDYSGEPDDWHEREPPEDFDEEADAERAAIQAAEVPW